MARVGYLPDYMRRPALPVYVSFYALIPVVTSEVDTVAVDAHWRLYVNPGWVAARKFR